MKRYGLPLGIAAGLLLGALLYGGVIGLPFFHDDAVVLRALSGQTPAEIWTSSALLPYYRPLSYLPWKLMQTAFGRADPTAAHALVWAGHLLNTALVALAAHKVARDGFAAFAAALIFAAFPFNYQAVAWVTAIPHILTLAGVLGTAILALYWSESGTRAALIGAWGCAFLATFAHENGVLTAPLAALILFAGGLRDRRKFAVALGPVVLMAAIFILNWWAAPKTTEGPAFSLESVFQNVVYFSQGIAHPASLFSPALVRRGLNDMAAVLLVSVPVIGGLVLILWVARMRWALAGLIWYVLALAPSVLFLGFNYVIDGPRLMYLASAGAALAWAGFWAIRPPDGKTLYGPIVTGLAGTLLLGGLFVRERMGIVYDMTGLYRAINAGAREIEEDERALFANIPAWAAPRDSDYALGHEGISFLADYMRLRDVIWANTGLKVDVETASFGAVRRELRHHAGFQGPSADADYGVLVRAMEKANVVFYTVEAGGWLELRRADRITGMGEPLAAFENGFELLSGAYDFEEGGCIRIELAWRASDAAAVTPFVHVTCNGEMVEALDGDPLGGLHPFANWEAGESWSEARVSMAAADPGCVSVFVGLYDPATGARIGADFPDDAVPLFQK